MFTILILSTVIVGAFMAAVIHDILESNRSRS